MKKIFFILIFITALLSPAFAQADSARHYLGLAANDGSIENFSRFAKYYDKLDKEQKENSKLTYDYMPYYYFLSILFTNRPNAEIFKIYLKTSAVLKSNAEGSEVIGEYFSHYFANNLPASLETLDKIPDAYLQTRLFEDACSVEKNEAKIYLYLTNNNLMEAASNKSYFKKIKHEHYLEVLNGYRNLQAAEPNRSYKKLYVTSDMDALLDTAYACLCIASEDGNIALFNEFVKYYEQLDWDRKSKIIVDDSFLYHFLAVLFTNRPSEETYNAYLAVADVLKISSSSFDIAKYFSYYFANNMPRSLEVLEKITDSGIISKISFDATSKEKNMIKIRDYVEKNKLQNKPYYKILNECFY